MSNHWITCTHCGEKRNASGDYTSPANREKDNWDWEKQHAYGACLKNKENEVISTETRIYNANRKIAAAEQDLKDAKDLLKQIQDEERAKENQTRIPVGTPVRNKPTRAIGQVKETGLSEVRVVLVGGTPNGVWLKPESLEILAPVKTKRSFRRGDKVMHIGASNSWIANNQQGQIVDRASEGRYIVRFARASLYIHESNLELID